MQKLFSKPRRRAEILSWHLRRQGKWQDAKTFSNDVERVRKPPPKEDPMLRAVKVLEAARTLPGSSWRPFRPLKIDEIYIGTLRCSRGARNMKRCSATRRLASKQLIERKLLKEIDKWQFEKQKSRCGTPAIVEIKMLSTMRCARPNRGRAPGLGGLRARKVCAKRFGEAAGRRRKTSSAEAGQAGGRKCGQVPLES